ncbi:endonuclease/exonuclease/phosphatase family protein [Deltaproteobacteria bacterium]|jgi:exodeoxyribonuclease III|nr:endonuclease/exonuclease/phosphatase family protein [Deltaproteobacteria bacterium]
MINATLRILSYNIYWGGHQKDLEETIEVIRKSGADLVGIQENVNREYEDQTPKIAKALGFSYVRHAVLDALEEFGAKGNKLRARWTQQAGQSTLSRHPITAQSPGGSGIQVELPSVEKVWMFNTHLWHYPYAPYQLMNVGYYQGDSIDPDTPEAELQAINSARIAHETEINKVLWDIKSILSSGEPVFLTGDFNEPSHLDWTTESALAGLHPLKVSFPTSKQVTEAGLKDAFRELFPDPVTVPGFTWPAGNYPETPDSSVADPEDRIDFIYFTGEKVQVKNVQRLGEAADSSDISFANYPSDHRAVLATFEL